MENCIFCAIVNKESPAITFYEDDKFVVFEDIKPQAPLDFLVVPKQHFDSLNDMNQKHKSLLGEMLLLAKKIAKENGISDAYQVHFNVGKKEQLVHHIHLHVWGGWKGNK